MADSGTLLDAAFLSELEQNLAGDAVVVAALVTAFEETAQQGMVRLHHAADASDLGRLREAAHYIRGGAQNLGATAVSKMCHTLEKRKLDAPWAEVQNDLAELGAALHETIVALRAWAKR